MTESVIKRLGKGFTDAAFVRHLDGTQTYKYIQFDCGLMYNTETHELAQGRPDLMISRTTGFPYPTEEFARLKTGLEANGIDLENILQGIKDNEELGQCAPYPRNHGGTPP